ncbi:type 2 lanthipeptide synthetase LanM family protein [Paenibacillus sp. FJAT-27812]|uniref:type 2 lanthipeptide synthetase LanM family protein n=1 Tax=Paenibacillus sp. FJAT-27812 TaxID=1684143 RepID=UPI0006A7DFCC|nr:type 2 lanthipeptide synthetase LanM family protein [Paenibacillus sp. FJAT-27812]
MTTKLRSIIDTRPFLNALTISERKELFKGCGITNNEYARLDEWVSTRGLGKEKEFLEMLADSGQTKTQFNQGFASLDDAVEIDPSDELSKHEWFKQFTAAMNDYYEQKDAYEQKIQVFDFSLSISPFLIWSGNELSAAIKQLRTIKIEPAALQTILEKIANSLVQISSKTMVWDLHQYKTTHVIEGEDSAQRFVDFIRKRFVDQDNLIQFYAKYPVLARRITMKCSFLITYFKEVLGNLDNHFYEVSEALQFDPQHNVITSLSCDQGDTHQQARFVVKILLGEATTIIYKPRNLRIQQRFAQFAEWFNDSSDLLDMRVNQAFYGDKFTFEQFISYKECATEEEVQRFYKRFGQLCALIYILRGNDIHFENIIACSQYPIIIDLETLFQQQSHALNFGDDALSAAFIECIESVAGTGLLPIVAFAKSDSKGIDISGLNGDTQVLPYKLLGLVDSSKDTMRYDYQEVVLKGGSNIVQLNGKKINYADYKMHILEGFERTMAFIQRNKRELIDEVLPLFKGTAIRHLLKATQNYAKLNEFSSHPNYTSDMLRMERLFFNSWGFNYRDKRGVPYEIIDLLNDDIPIFYGEADSKDLISSTGVRIANYFKESTYDMVSRLIENLTDDEVVKQVTHMKVTFGMHDGTTDTGQCLNDKPAVYEHGLDVFGADAELLLKEADKIAEVIMKEAIFGPDGKTLNWNNVLYDDIHHCWKMRPLDGGLYQGLPGILLFLYALDKINGQNKYSDAIQLLIHSIVSSPLSDKGLSAYYDSVSALFPLAVMYADNRSPEIHEHILRFSTYLRDNQQLIQYNDWISGHAGIVKLMIVLHKLLGEQLFLDIAEVSVGCIMDKLSIDQIAEEKSGMAHGIVGMASALLAYVEVAPTQKGKDYTNELLNVVQSRLREENGTSTSWCNGIVGIGNALSAQLQIADIPLREQLISRMVKQISSGLKQEDSLCHGNMGDLEFLLNVYETSPDAEVKQLINEKISAIWAEAERRPGYQFRTVPGYTTVGLFTGITGIGYTMLRLYNSKKVPDVLNLELSV